MTLSTLERSAAGSPEERYDWTREEAKALTQELLATRPPEGDERFVCYMLHGSDQYANIGRAVEGEVFMDAFKNTPEDMQREYGPYEQQSTFFISIDRETEQPTGTLRIIENGPAGLKTLNDLEERKPNLSMENVSKYHGIGDLEKCWDVGTVAVLPEHRSAEGGISIQLYRGMYVAAMEAGVQHFVSLIDDRAYKKLTGFLGIPFKSLAGAEPFDYLGSKKSHPVYGYVPEFYEKMNKGRSWRPKKLLARNVLKRLVDGEQDDALQFGSSYKK